MKKAMLVILYCSVVFIVISCHKKPIKNKKELTTYMLNEHHGLVKSKVLENVKLTIKCLPQAYLTYQCIEGCDILTSIQIDSVSRSYTNSLSFLISVEPVGEGKSGVTKVGVRNYEEFTERINQLSFHLGEYVSIEVNNERVLPELVHFENISESGSKKNFLVVFSQEKVSELSEEESFKLVYQDEYFNSGLNKFQFSWKDLASVPECLF